ncbi:MAG: hypothetical protein KGZ82_05725 [Bacteroidales bacterium]|nr:hypothetical protein [Bacteroidales bacterium]MBS4056796.1 hypothetical protein [Bacteroidales bacterium]
MNFDETLNILKEKQGLASLEQVAKYLGLSRGGFYDMKGGRGALSDKTLERIMEGTGLPAPIIFAAWSAEHSKSETIRKSWQEWLRNAAAIVAMAGVLTNDADSRAYDDAGATIEQGGIAHNAYYTKPLTGTIFDVFQGIGKIAKGVFNIAARDVALFGNSMWSMFFPGCELRLMVNRRQRCYW